MNKKSKKALKILGHIVLSAIVFYYPAIYLMSWNQGLIDFLRGRSELMFYVFSYLHLAVYITAGGFLSYGLRINRKTSFLEFIICLLLLVWVVIGFPGGILSTVYPAPLEHIDPWAAKGG